MKKKRYCFVFILSLLFIPFLCIQLHNRFSFSDFTQNIFLSEVSKDTLSLHYTLANPQAYGIQSNPVSLPVISVSDELVYYSSLENYLSCLSSFVPNHLSHDEAYTYALLEKKLTHDLEGHSYFYYQEFLSPQSGIQNGYPVLMADYAFRCKEDIDHYLSLLSDTPHYFDSILSFEQEKQRRGFFMPDFALQKTINQCQSIITLDSLNENRHFLQNTFEERLNLSISENFITETEKNDYIARHNRILATIVYPAYINMAKELSKLKGSGKNEKGLCYYPDGKAYYQWLFTDSTGSYISPDVAYQKLAADYYHNLQLLEEDLNTLKKDCDLNTKDIQFFPLETADLMLNHLSNSMTLDFPSLSSLYQSDSLAVEVRPVSSFLEDYSAPAYYMIPPIDDIYQNTIYINHKDVSNGLNLYHTLAHEGYPGHLYQTVYYKLYAQNKKTLPIRTILDYGGYCEGWAIYTELYSYDYATSLLSEESNKKSYPVLYSLYANERKAQLSLLSLLDIAIHYYGISYARVIEILKSYGVNKESDIREIYEYIIEEPTNYPKYYWGYMELMELKKMAQKIWGHSYSDYAFHQFILQAGPSDFDTLKEELQRTVN